MRRRAFTMVEMIVVIVCVAVLATISYVSYMAIVNRARSGDSISMLSSYLTETQSLWVTDRNRDWGRALDRAVSDLPAGDGWSVRRTVLGADDPSGGAREIVAVVDGNTVGIAVAGQGSSRNCFGRIQGTGSAQVWCDNDTPTGDEALGGPELTATTTTSTTTAPTTTLPAPSIFDMFDRDITGGWGTSSSGQGWGGSASGSPVGVADGVGWFDMDADGSQQRTQSIPAAGDFDVTLRGRTVTLPESSFVQLRVYPRNQSATTVSNTYIVNVTVHPNGSVTTNTSRWSSPGPGVSVAGNQTALGAGALSAGDWLRIRVQAQGAAIRTKVWLDGDAEPGGWTTDGVDPEPENGWATGTLHIGVNKGGPAMLVEFDDITLYPTPMP